MADNNALTIIALIVIVLSVAKLVVFSLSPTGWLTFAGKLYRNPQITAIVAGLLAALVLFFLVQSGVTIVQILATWAFLALIMMTGFATYAKDLLDWAKKRDRALWFKEQWLQALIWFGLIVWGSVWIASS